MSLVVSGFVVNSLIQLLSRLLCLSLFTLLFFILLLIIIAPFVIIAAGILVEADGRLYGIVAQQHLRVLVQIIEASPFGPEQPLRRRCRRGKESVKMCTRDLAATVMK